MVSAATLATARTAMQTLMVSAVDETHPTGYTSDDTGFAPTWSTAVTTVCHYNELSGQELIRAQQIAPEADCAVYMPAGTAVYTTSHLTITRDDSTLLELEVEHVAERPNALHQKVLCKSLGVTPVTPTPTSLTFMERAYLAVTDDGWQNLGPITPSGASLHESDLLYNVDDGYYYLFNTETAAGQSPGGPYTITAWTKAANVASGGTGDGTLTIGGGHNIPVGQWQTLNVTGTAVGMNGSRTCQATSTTAFYVLTTTGTTALSGSSGSAAWVTNSRIGMRRATTIEGLATASGSNYVAGVASNVYFPTVVYVTIADGGPLWYVFGYDNSANNVRKVFSGSYPNVRDAFPLGAGSAINSLKNQNPTGNSTVGDMSIRKHPTDGYYYLVCTDGRDPTPSTNIIYRIAAASIATDAWVLYTANIWADTGLPTPGSASCVVDPNLCFFDGHVYLTAVSTPTQSANDFATFMVELNATTMKATGLPLPLQTYATTPSFQHSSVMGDPMYIHDITDGTDRIIGFTSGDYTGSVTGTLANLVLGDA